jgi:hypothetical protein
VLKEHVVLGRKPDAGTHDVHQAGALREQRVHHCARKDTHTHTRTQTYTHAYTRTYTRTEHHTQMHRHTERLTETDTTPCKTHPISRDSFCQ